MAQNTLLRLKTCFCSLLVLFLIYACKQQGDSADVVPDAKFASYVTAYTGGLISQTSTIRIELAQDLPVVELNTEVGEKLFSFSPSLKGKAYWISNNIVEFVPEEGALKPGTTYKTTFQLGKVIEVEKDLRKLEFTFRVMDRNFALSDLSMRSSRSGFASISGSLLFSDAVDKKDVDKAIKAYHGKTTYPVTVESTENPAIYRFDVQDIPKEDTDKSVTIEADGASLGINNKLTRSYTIPAKGKFTFLSARQITDPENGIEIVFSEPLSISQDLKGLITVQGVNSPTFQISDNTVKVYYDGGSRSYRVNVYAGIKSADGKKLEEGANVSFSQASIKPQVELLTSGTIMPDSKNLILPFRAVSLYAVDLTVIRIFESNVLSFLQTNSLSTSNELRRFGRMVYKNRYRLDSDPTKDITKWEEYSIDMSGVIKQEPGAIYWVMLSFKQDYSAYSCDGSGMKQFSESGLTGFSVGNGDENDESVWDIPESYYNPQYAHYDWREYNWEERDNPCDPSYYMVGDRYPSCNVLASDIGMIVKRNSGNNMWVAVNNILDTNPVEQAEITAYNFQLQPIGSAKTNIDGFAEIALKGVPFAVVASSGKQKTYVKVIDGEELSTSRFDVGGKEIKKGLKGFIYGERGVWRPGDTLHISFMLEDKQKRIPDKHPVSIELYNPRGQFYNKLISTNGVNGLYTFHIPTKQDDPTGLWNAYVKVGGTSFHKSLRIETVKPNRLKINLKLPNNELIEASDGNVRVTLSSNWLTGATASNLKAKVELSLSKMNTQFANYSQYIFNNPATSFETSKEEVFEGTLDSSGDATFTMQIPESDNAPGMLRANIISRVFEPGGDASINNFTVPFSPFDSYVGINLNQPKDKYIETDQDHVFDVVTLNPQGKPVSRSQLEYKIYRVSWYWWWEKRDESFESYINNSSYTPVETGTLKTVNGKGSFTFRVNYPSWGRYLVYVKDRNSGHATGGTVYIDWPYWRGRSNKSDPSGLTMLSFSIDKESYEVGEKATAIIPASANGRALVTFENGSTILKQQWIQLSSEEDTRYEFDITPEMAPNVYLNVTLLQPHAQTVNELPIRMFGVVPVFVTDKQTVLEPEINMQDVLRPEKEFSVTVSEKNGKPMTYTLAIVDDGLLDLTNFKTPDPWNEFFAREALGIRSWDMYDQVMGAYSGVYSSLFSTGGDEMLKQSDDKANRFRPVVKYLGPFTLKKGGKDTHKITLPMYVGSVRTMIVAGQDGAYGNAEKTTPVRSPLMVLTTLPRVLSIGEEIFVPVNVFAMEESVKNVTVSIETSQNLKLDESKQSVTFSKTGDKLLYFRMKVGQSTGKEIVRIKAEGGAERTEEMIEIDVRNPNPVVTHHESKLITSGQTAQLNYQLGNPSDENWVRLEVSRIPSVDISRRFDYLYNYQHYCSEQLTSRALPLLFIPQFKDTDKKEMENIRKNVQEAIKNLYSRQLSNGGIIYWPGYSHADEWITSYAGQFLVMAQEKGYDVNSGVLNKWKAFQRSAAQSWTPENRDSGWYYWQSDLIQAYRLYTLALAGSPELGAMNRMKEVKNLSLQARWRLAAAYALAGKENAANELVFNAPTDIEAYSAYNDVYGSNDRDEAMILETLVYLKKDKEAFVQAQKISKKLSSQNYFSTQSTAFALMAMGRLAESLSGSLDIDWSLNNAKQGSVKSTKALYQADIPTTPLQGQVSVKNNGKGTVYADLVSRTQLLNDTLSPISNGLRIDVKYVDMAGSLMSVSDLKQGTDFVAEVTVSNTSGTTDYKDLALTHIVPSGWEIYNERMENPDEEVSAGNSQNRRSTQFDYQDIRDDRVLTYFSLQRGKGKIIRVRLQATYAGEYVLPAVHCEAMYDVEVQARTKAGKVTVKR